DDMQWADAASLNLVTVLLSAPATESLLVVQAYRDNEVSPTHPFMLAVKEQQARGVQIDSIALVPLEPDAIAQFVADTLHQDRARVAELAEIVHAKTDGNPFFMRQFVQKLYADRLIEFDPVTRAFRCDLGAVHA